MHYKVIVMNVNDNCATTLEDIPTNTEIKVGKRVIKINQEIPIGHKFALIDIKQGDFILKYGEVIGIATKDIKSGDWIHIHNVKSQYLSEGIE